CNRPPWAAVRRSRWWASSASPEPATATRRPWPRCRRSSNSRSARSTRWAASGKPRRSAAICVGKLTFACSFGSFAQV
ncbi:MAG: hypothetical protein FGM52_01975, partial [Mycobacterium sp.]|nr:hypothetical protein [Mycobacterium sp.]